MLLSCASTFGAHSIELIDVGVLQGVLELSACQPSADIDVLGGLHETACAPSTFSNWGRSLAITSPAETSRCSPAA